MAQVLGYEDSPLRDRTRAGARWYGWGRSLVERDGVRLQDILWDADEVLWDWVMDMREVLRRHPREVWRRSVGHREYFLVKPGVFELLWGMHHASREAGLDPFMRIWTNGYPWRLWRLGQHLPGLLTLLGLEDAEGDLGREAVARSPHVFSRPDYVAAVSPVLLAQGAEEARRARLGAEQPAVRALMEAHLAERPQDSSLKLPELARWVAGKEPLHGAKVLVDDQPLNVARFVGSGRQAVQVVVRQPLLFHRAVNMTWGEPVAHLRARSRPLAAGLAGALGMLARGEAPSPHLQALAKPEEAVPARVFDLDIPDEVLRAEWIQPMKPLKALAKARGRGRARGPGW